MSDAPGKPDRTVNVDGKDIVVPAEAVATRADKLPDIESAAAELEAKDAHIEQMRVAADENGRRLAAAQKDADGKVSQSLHLLRLRIMRTQDRIRSEVTDAREAAIMIRASTIIEQELAKVLTDGGE